MPHTSKDLGIYASQKGKSVLMQAIEHSTQRQAIKYRCIQGNEVDDAYTAFELWDGYQGLQPPSRGVIDSRTGLIYVTL